jgi:hypothetical protein
LHGSIAASRRAPGADLSRGDALLWANPLFDRMKGWSRIVNETGLNYRT